MFYTNSVLLEMSSNITGLFGVFCLQREHSGVEKDPGGLSKCQLPYHQSQCMLSKKEL